MRQRYIRTLVNDYGYSLEQMAQEKKLLILNVDKKLHELILLFEKRGRKRYKKKSAFIVVECKSGECAYS